MLNKISIIMVIFVIFIDIGIANDNSSKFNLNTYKKLFKEGNYERVVHELSGYFKSYNEWCGPDISDSTLTEIVNLLADSYCILGKYNEARKWYARNSEGMFDSHATYCYEVIARTTVSLGTFDPSFDYYSIYSNSPPEEILIRVLRQFFENTSSAEKRKYFRKLIIDKLNKKDDWISQLVKFCAGDLGLNDIWSKTPSQFIGTVSTYAGLSLEFEGKTEDARKLYLKALAQKGSTNIELILAARRLGLLVIKDVFYNSLETQPINFTYLYTVRASSAKLGDGCLYSVFNLLDGNLNTTWVPEGKKSGLGEWMEVSFDDPLSVTSLNLVNGYAKSEASFQNNNRIKTATLEFSDGSKQLITLEDTVEPQNIQIDKNTQKIRLIINEVYKGSKFDDTCLSDLDVMYDTSLGRAGE